MVTIVSTPLTNAAIYLFFRIHIQKSHLTTTPADLQNISRELVKKMWAFVVIGQSMYSYLLTTAGNCDGSRTEWLAKGLPGEAQGNQDQHV